MHDGGAGHLDYNRDGSAGQGRLGGACSKQHKQVACCRAFLTLDGRVVLRYGMWEDETPPIQSSRSSGVFGFFLFWFPLDTQRYDSMTGGLPRREPCSNEEKKCGCYP